MDREDLTVRIFFALAVIALLLGAGRLIADDPTVLPVTPGVGYQLCSGSTPKCWCTDFGYCNNEDATCHQRSTIYCYDYPNGGQNPTTSNSYKIYLLRRLSKCKSSADLPGDLQVSQCWEYDPSTLVCVRTKEWNNTDCTGTPCYLDWTATFQCGAFPKCD
jgi:hypothetical protein